mgnify:CR=1 FL=1
MFASFPTVLFASFGLVSLLLALYYAWLMQRYYRHWQALPEWNPPSSYTARTSITVIVPARNEAANIEACLHSILNQAYPTSHYEILVVDDHSTDATPQLVAQLARLHPHLRLLHLRDAPLAENEGAYKKKAIEWAIQHSRGELLVTTDADCRVPPRWLPLLASYYEREDAVFIAAPVNFDRERTAFERFQSLDFVGMMGITGAGIYGAFQHMCNGANLAYRKPAFYAVGGFSGIDQRASGDDMLLLQKMARRFPGRIGFVKNPAATVRTTAMPTIRSFVQQRLRWASKSRDYPEWRVTLRLALVFFYCWSILLAALLLPFFGGPGVLLFLLLLGTKMVVDYAFLRTMSRYFGRLDLLRSFVVSAWYHLWYIAVVGLLANVVQRYEWKGRVVR